MPFANLETHVNKCFAIFMPLCHVIFDCDVMLPWITTILGISRYSILSRDLLATGGVIHSMTKRVIQEIYKRCQPFTFGINKNLESPDMAWMPWMYTPGVGVTKAPFVNFSVSKILDLSKLPHELFESHLYLTGATAAELRRHLSNINVIFNS